MATDQPYAWRNARSTNSRASTAEEMAAKGRAPSYGRARSGEMFIRGFRSRPGAPQAGGETMVGLGIAGEPGRSPERDAAWSAFFSKPALPTSTAPTPAAPNPSGDYMGADLSALAPTTSGNTFLGLDLSAPSNPQQNLAATIAGNSDWMTSRGLQPPPQPSIIPNLGGGWNGPASPVAAGNFRSRFGSASVSYTPPPATVKNPWRKLLPTI